MKIYHVVHYRGLSVVFSIGGSNYAQLCIITHNYAYYVHNYANFHISIYCTYNNLNHFTCDNHLTCDKRALCDRGFPVSLAFGERSEPIASTYINHNYANFHILYIQQSESFYL